MNLSKRTKEQLDYSEEVNKDFTGGYNLLTWIIWVERVKGVAVIAFLAASAFCFLSTEDSLAPVFQFWTGIACFIVSIIILILTVRQYNQMKKGISI
jgi:hypothetical protein